jgi:thymidine kinase
VAKLYFRYSAMNAGKSTSLLQVAHNYEEQGQKVQLYTAKIDNRYGVGLITSRLGPQREVDVFDGGTDFLAARPKCPACWSTKRSSSPRRRWCSCTSWPRCAACPVICYGLRSDFRGDPSPARPTCWRWPTTSRKSRTSAAAARRRR